MKYCIITTGNGDNFCFPFDRFEEFKEQLDPMEFIFAEDINGSYWMISKDAIVSMSTSTPETRRSWERHNAYMNRERQQIVGEMSNPINQL